MAQKPANLTPGQKRALLARLLEEKASRNAPARPLAHLAFEAQARLKPDAVAVIDTKGQSLTYAELDHRAGQLARYLQSLGATAETLVGLCTDRSIDMVVALLGILKAGAAYLPLDPEYPRDRLEFMLNDSGASLLLTQQPLLERMPQTPLRTLLLDADRPVIERQPAPAPLLPPLPPPSGANLAYVIYTSGSTGKPKGVMIPHEALANFLFAMEGLLAFGKDDSILAITTLSFDISVLELFLPLSVGARIELATRDEASDGPSLARRIQASHVRFLQATPATWRLLLDSGWKGQRGLTLLCGGEAMSRDLAERLVPLGDKVWNVYGPTETTVWSTADLVESGAGPISIGRPIANTQAYILDKNLQPVPIGVVGELYIAGDGLARGYLKRPALSASRFLPNPFGKPGTRLYQTGDLARWRRDGTIECLGRSDHQVKIRGHRIELDEVQNALADHPLVRNALAVARPDALGLLQLVAYYVPSFEQVEQDELELSPQQLRKWLKTSLPEPMIPSAFVRLDAFPLTPNGKLDRNALPDPEDFAEQATHPYQEPATDTQRFIASTWEEVLKRPKIGLLDDFFELGGHSLLATQVVSRLRSHFQREIPLRTLFEATTVETLAQVVESLKGKEQEGSGLDLAASGASIPRALQREMPPASIAQQALWFLDQLAPGLPTFNIDGAARLRGELDVEALRLSFNEVVRRHESLRTTFSMSDGRPYQVIAPARDLPLEQIDLGHLADADREAEAERIARSEAQKPFDLTGGPLARALLLRLAPNDHILLLTMHHIITDGWSFGVAVRELATAYEAAKARVPSPLPPLPIQYADFAIWQRGWLNGGVLDRLIAYWTSKLEGVSPLELPTDHPRPAVRAARGANLPITIGPELTARLETLGRKQGATPFMVLLSAFQVLLYRYSGQDDFAVGTPIANRNRPETEGLIGYFVNMLALRADLSGDPTFLELLGRTRQVALEAYDHQDLSLDKLIEVLKPPRDLSRTPLFQVMFVLQNAPMPTLGHDGLTLEPLFVDQGNGTAKFDLTLALQEQGNTLTGGVEFNTELFEPATIARMLEHFQILLKGIAAEPTQRLSRLPLLASTERTWLLAQARAQPAEPTPLERIPCIQELFEAQVDRDPKAEALVHNGARVTYGEIEQRSNQLAHYLQALGVLPEQPVAICLSDPFDKIWAVLGVLKAGGAYLPLDPTLPRARLGSIVEEARAPFLLTERDLQDTVPVTQARRIVRDIAPARDQIDEQPTTRPERRSTSANLAYVISTSGSLGQPKGVAVTHASLFHAFQSWKRVYELDQPGSRHLQMANFAFDVFTGDWVRALGSGGTLVFCPREVILDANALYDLMVEERVDCAEFVPTVIENLMPALEASGRSLDFLRLLVVGSDLWRAGEYERLKGLAGPRTRVINSYGLTEATIDSTYFEGNLADRPVDRPVPIGRPLPHAQVYVLDANLEPVPVGVPGELHVGGPGLARGYQHRASLTAKAFLPNPFSNNPGDRLYRTGDQARWLPDGQLEILGRVDHQVKVRGFRVELAEVEGALAQHPDVREAAAVVQDRNLVAYLVARPGHTIQPEALRRDLLQILPRPMIPSTFLVLEALPLTTSGKVDRNALPPIPTGAGVGSGRGNEVVPPEDDIERTLVEIWEELLNLSPVGVTDDFFELGGHSLLAVRLTARVEERFGRKLPLSTLFLGATIRDLATLLRQEDATEPAPWTPLVPIQPEGAERPFFCVHPIGGTVMCYHDLARKLGQNRPFFGLQAAGIEEEPPAETSLTAMAARYLESIRDVQPVGPYLLGGWSLGGVVAFEMARQLLAQGERVETLVMIDTKAPPRSGIGRAAIPSEQQLRSAFVLDLARGLGAGALSQNLGLPLGLELREEDLQRLARDPNALALPEALTAELGAERLARLERVFRANAQALANYRPGPYEGRIVLIKGRGRLGEGLLDPSLGWRALTSGEVVTHALPGDHYALLRPPLVENLAQLIHEELALTEAKPSPM